jgi:hypothetical protein
VAPDAPAPSRQTRQSANHLTRWNCDSRIQRSLWYSGTGTRPIVQTAAAGNSPAAERNRIAAAGNSPEAPAAADNHNGRAGVTAPSLRRRAPAPGRKPRPWSGSCLDPAPARKHRRISRRRPHAAMRYRRSEMLHVEKAVNGMAVHVEEHGVRHRRIGALSHSSDRWSACMRFTLKVPLGVS